MSDSWKTLSNNVSTPVASNTPSTKSAQAGGKVSIGNGRASYPNPLFDMTSTYLPNSMKEILVFLASVALTDPLASQSIAKFAEYPITDMIYGEGVGNEFKENNLKQKWKDILEDSINIKDVLKQCGMDYNAYGISVISVNYPFRRMLECTCGESHNQETTGVRFKNWKFHSKCPKCGKEGDHFIAKDYLTRNFKKLSIVHWDLMNMDIKYNSITGDHFFYYTVPNHIKEELGSGNMDFVKSTRIEVIRAAQKKSKVKLSDTNLHFMKRIAPQYIYPSERGWGVSVLFSVMKDVFHNKILKKGNEMIAMDHIVPLRILHPMATGEVSPHLMMDLSQWRGSMDAEVNAWRKDPNRIMYAPLPIGIQQLGGDAKALSVTPEIKATDDNIIVGTGMIPEILKGGASWSGSNVSLRIIENTYLGQRRGLHGAIDFISNNISDTYNIPRIPIKMADFKMADDLNQKQMMMKAAEGSPANAMISHTTAIKELGFDPEEEFNNKEEDLRKRISILSVEKGGFATAEGEASVINAIFQADAQAENQNRLQMREREGLEDKQKAEQVHKEEKSRGIYDEISQVAGGMGISPESINPSNIITKITERVIDLSKTNQDAYSKYMLRLKGSYPNLFNVVMNNIKEANTLIADANPDLDMAQRYTPGELPQYTQGDISGSDTSPEPVEQGGTSISGPIQSNPVKPPSGAGAGI